MITARKKMPAKVGSRVFERSACRSTRHTPLNDIKPEPAGLKFKRCQVGGAISRARNSRMLPSGIRVSGTDEIIGAIRPVSRPDDDRRPLRGESTGKCCAEPILFRLPDKARGEWPWPVVSFL